MSKTNRNLFHSLLPSALKILACAPLFLTSVVSVSHAQTLDSLIIKQRELMMDEANKKAAKAIPNASAPPQQLQAPQVSPQQITQLPALPQLGMPGMSSTEPAKPVAPPPVIRAVFDIRNAHYLAVYGVADDLTAEISYNGAIAKLKPGMPLIDGWTVKSIAPDFVVVKKTDEKGVTITEALQYNRGDPVIRTEQVPKKPATHPRKEKRATSTKASPTSSAPTVEELAKQSIAKTPNGVPAATATPVVAPVAPVQPKK
jgi:hypothetical protein